MEKPAKPSPEFVEYTEGYYGFIFEKLGIPEAAVLPPIEQQRRIFQECQTRHPLGTVFVMNGETYTINSYTAYPARKNTAPTYHCGYKGKTGNTIPPIYLLDRILRGEITIDEQKSQRTITQYNVVRTNVRRLLNVRSQREVFDQVEATKLVMRRIQDVTLITNQNADEVIGKIIDKVLQKK